MSKREPRYLAGDTRQLAVSEDQFAHRRRLLQRIAEIAQDPADYLEPTGRSQFSEVRAGAQSVFTELADLHTLEAPADYEEALKAWSRKFGLTEAWCIDVARSTVEWDSIDDAENPEFGWVFGDGYVVPSVGKLANDDEFVMAYGYTRGRLSPSCEELNPMGFLKDLDEQLRGGNPEACFGRYVCAECFADDDLRAFVESNASRTQCDFCEATSEYPIAAHLLDVVQHMNQCLDRYYSTAENELPFESAEGGYQGQWWDTWDFVEGVLGLEFPKDTGDLEQAIRDSLGQRAWCERDPFGLDEEAHLWLSWEQFCEVVKFERRFFFAQQGSSSISGPLNPRATLAALAEVFAELGLIADLPAGTEIWRARVQRGGATLQGPADLGPPPREFARQSRMSPAGVVMFYAGEDEETALRETANGAGDFVMAKFRTLQATRVLDLAAIPRPPSIFNLDVEVSARLRHRFLSRFADEIAQPVERDDRVHIDYVPTQVVTEFVRSSVGSGDGQPVMGIRYASSRSPGRSALVLFADRRHVVGVEPELARILGIEPWIELVQSQSRVLSPAEWAAMRL